MNRYEILTNREDINGIPVKEQAVGYTYEIKNGYLTFYDNDPDLPGVNKLCTYDKKEWKKVTKIIVS
jgi:hypothetical protein